MKIAIMFYHLLAFITLACFAALQLNDPDALFWFGFYGLCAITALLGAFKIDIRIPYALCLLYGVVVLWNPTTPGFIEFLRHAGTESLLYGMSPDRPYIEEAREFLGSCIALGLVTICFFISFKRKRTASI